MWPLWRGAKYIIRGEGDGLPQVQAVVSLVNLNCSWFVLAPKVLQLCINHLVLVLCRFVWVIKACQFFLVPSRSSSMPLYPSTPLKCCEPRSMPWFFALSLFSIWTHIWVPQGVGNASYTPWIEPQFNKWFLRNKEITFGAPTSTCIHFHYHYEKSYLPKPHYLATRALKQIIYNYNTITWKYG
jgi:hypothetical protein